jgi:hypothetical protein
VGFFNLRLGFQKLLAPKFAGTFSALVNDVPYAETVVALSAIVAGKFSALRARVEWNRFGVAVLFVELELTGDAHGVLPGARWATIVMPTLARSLDVSGNLMVARDGIEPPTPEPFQELRSFFLRGFTPRAPMSAALKCSRRP